MCRSGAELIQTRVPALFQPLGLIVEKVCSDPATDSATRRWAFICRANEPNVAHSCPPGLSSQSMNGRSSSAGLARPRMSPASISNAKAAAFLAATS